MQTQGSTNACESALEELGGTFKILPHHLELTLVGFVSVACAQGKRCCCLLVSLFSLLCFLHCHSRLDSCCREVRSLFHRIRCGKRVACGVSPQSTSLRASGQLSGSFQGLSRGSAEGPRSGVKLMSTRREGKFAMPHIRDGSCHTLGARRMERFDVFLSSTWSSNLLAECCSCQALWTAVAFCTRSWAQEGRATASLQRIGILFQSSRCLSTTLHCLCARGWRIILGSLRTTKAHQGPLEVCVFVFAMLRILLTWLLTLILAEIFTFFQILPCYTKVQALGTWLL